jgi:hypothetical protein
MAKKRRKIAEVVSTEQTTNSKVEKTPENDPEMVRQASKLSETIGKPNSKKRSETASELMSDGLSIANDSQTKPQYAPTDDKYVNRPDLENRVGENYRYNEENIKEIKAGRGNVENKFSQSTSNPNNPFGSYDNENLGVMKSKYGFTVSQELNRSLPGSTSEEGWRENQTWMGLKGVIPGEPVEPIKGQSLVTKIQENPVAQVTQNEILNTGVKDASSPSQLQQAVDISTEAKKEAEKMEGDIDEAVTTSENGAPQPINIQEQAQTVPGDGSTVSNIVSTEGQNIRPTYDQVATTQDAQQGMVNMYAKLNEGVPKAVVEKLGIQDYYPNIGRDIAVGTFSGSRIGSQTIYSGAGAVLPMGLYDARKRALKEAATEKKKQLDKFFDVIETAPQYQKAVNESYNDWLNKSLSEHGYDADKFLSNPNIRKEYAKRLSNAKDITFWATWSDNYLKESEKKENYGTAEGVEIAGQIKMALIDHMDEIASGEKSLKDFIDIDKAKMYQNIIPQMDVIIKEALDPNRMGESPINMRTGDAEGRLSAEEFKQQRDDFVLKMKSETIGKDEYLSGFKKFFTGNYEQIVDGLIKSGKFSEEQRDAALNYFAGQMQEQIKLNPQFVDNDAAEMARLAEDRRQFNKEFERKVEEGKSPWTVQNELMNKPNANTGKNMQQELLEARKKGYTGTRLKTYMLRKAREMGFPNAQWDDHLGTVVMKSPASQYESNNYWNVSTTGQQASIKLFKKQGKKWVPFTMPLSDFVTDQNAALKYKFDDGSSVTAEDHNAWKNAWKQNSVAIRPSAYESYYGVSGSGTGIQRPVNSTTIKDYDPNRAVNIKNSIGTGYGYNVIKDEKGNIVPGADGNPQYIKKALKGTIFTVTDINDETQRRVADGLFGNDAKQLDYTLQGGSSSTSSGSSSSSQE